MTRLDLRLRIGDELPLLEYSFLHTLAKAGVTFRFSEDHRLQAFWRDLVVYVAARDQPYILNELLIGHVYDFYIPGDVVVLDIGANVGMTALYMAHRMPNAFVHGFELVPSTFRQALDNVALNPALLSRIELHNYGISDGDRSVEIEYSDDFPGSATLPQVGTLPSRLPNARAQCAVRDIATVWQELGLHTGHRTVVLKIDCEGSEYVILRRLEQLKLLPHIAFVAMEWHRFNEDHRPQDLRERFERNGFLVISAGLESDAAGMMYAYNLGARPSVNPPVV